MHRLDPTDIKLLQHLQHDGRISERQLAALVYRSPLAVHDRLVRLREQGYIWGFTILWGMSLSPRQIAEEIKKHIPDFVMGYAPDFRQEIADSWLTRSTTGWHVGLGLAAGTWAAGDGQRYADRFTTKTNGRDGPMIKEVEKTEAIQHALFSARSQRFVFGCCRLLKILPVKGPPPLLKHSIVLYTFFHT
jgi:hypothetical protein